MVNKYKLWKLSYSYKASHIDGEDSVSEVYLIVAGSEAEALNKADEIFSSDSPLQKDLLVEGHVDAEGVSLFDLRRNAREYRKKISFPKLSLDSDKEKFGMRVSIGSDKKTLEFIVAKK